LIHTVEYTTPTSSSNSKGGPSLEITSTTACGAAPTWLTLSEDGQLLICFLTKGLD